MKALAEPSPWRLTLAVRWILVAICVVIGVPLTYPIELGWRRGEWAVASVSIFASFFLLAVAMAPFGPRRFQWACFALSALTILPYSLGGSPLHFLANAGLHCMAAVVLAWDTRCDADEQDDDLPQEK